jgi:hypothetical protein
MGGLEIRKNKKCHFTSKIFNSMGREGKENDMDNTFVLRGIKNPKVGFSRISHGPCEVFSTAFRLWCKEGLSGQNLLRVQRNRLKISQ